MLLGEREFQLMQPSAYFVNTTQVAQTIVDAIKR